MRHSARLLLTSLAAVMILPVFADAHFVMLQPTGWIVEDMRGDPQKAGPCGGTSADPGKPSNVVGHMTGGQQLHIRLMETVYHPGHYRISLAVNSRAELPPDPMATTRDTPTGPRSVSAAIQNPAMPPVIVDGLFVHTVKPTDPWETDITLPNINCPKCTLQVVEFMAEHGVNKDGDFTYHHCADMQITADPKKPIDKRWPASR